jgi:polyisoprenoid-binding protein YceI
MKKLNVLFALLLMAGVASAQTTNWGLDRGHSKVGFSATHFVVSETEGEFKDFDVKVASTAADFNGASVEFTAKVASINTDNEKRDGHLKSDDFFNAEKFPEIKFVGKLEKKGNKYVLNGNLTIRDVTKPVSFEVTYGGTTYIEAYKATKAGFKLKGKINRFDYNLKWSAKNGADYVVGEEVELNVKVELNKQA